MLVEEGVIAPEDMALFSFVDTPEAAWEAIQSFYRLDNGENLF
jgi:predicted Rossmann-fold nucleotide-binding protein